MKVLAVLIIAVASVSGKGSGPYLPSGWRPEGPAFYLPSEVAKPSPTPVVDISLQGSEASGSDFLQEYGPPKVLEVSQNLINQGLPDVSIEQDFGFAQNNEVASDVAAEKLEEVSEVKSEAITTEVTATESQTSADDSPPISAELPIIDFEVQGTTVANVEQSTELSNQQLNQEVSQETLENQQESSTVLSELESTASAADVVENAEVLSVTNVVPTASAQPVEANVPELQNIPAIIASLEQEILTQEAEINHVVSEISSVEGVSGALEQVPEGFLEYGPPGFAEYGPPKEEQVKSENLRSIESNETRRRRFSPKFRRVRKH